jgi:hypothetical protein
MNGRHNIRSLGTRSRARDGAQCWWERHGQKNLKAQRYQAQVWQKTMPARFEDYRENPKGHDSVAQGVADWLTVITELATERQKQRLEQPMPVEVQIVNVNKKNVE